MTSKQHPAFVDRADPEIVPVLDFVPGTDLGIGIPEARARSIEALDGLRSILPVVPGVTSRDVMIAGEGTDPEVMVRVYEPVGGHDGSALLYIHGGGMVVMRVTDTDFHCEQIVADVGCMVVSVEYRLAPEHPHPAPMRDCYAALRWIHGEASSLGLDPSRIGVGGSSAGGGLSAGLAIEARDRAEFPLCFQWLLYPMLDDRNETPSSHEITEPRVWNRSNNVIAWDAYLGDIDRSAVPITAAPARAGVDDLRDLPPAYIDVGEVDAFRDEDIAYAAALLQAGVPTELHVTPGAFHASEVYNPAAGSSTRIAAYRVDALRRGLAAATTTTI
ncbi:alpha/beta hydrolase [Actinospongicola halichondriae]|uniref:alpha/beta hydrolase n=1 Tax=Actinospongicola halichondriae TaxID=3236844 RepID=UPI003D5B8F6B